MFSLQLYILAVLFGLFLGLGQAHPLDRRGMHPFPPPPTNTLDPGCNAACQYARGHPPKPHPPGTISFIDWAPPSGSCSGNVCSTTSSSEPLIQLDGAQFGPDTYADFRVFSRANGAQLFAALAPVSSLGYTGIETPLRDCTNVPGAAQNNAYARAYDARASAWSKEIGLSTGCTEPVL
jgi:hypothetical protein